MKKVNLLKYGLTALMMAFAMTLCYSCSNDDDDPTVEEPTPPTNGESKINGHAYVELAGYKWATENASRVSLSWAIPIAFPDIRGNEWGCYLYQQVYAKPAAASWGGTWKLPTKAQWQKLIDECYWEWTNDYNGKSGYIVYEAQADVDKGKYKSKYYNYTPLIVYSIDKVPHIFLPAAGVFHYGGSRVTDQGSNGFYWSADDREYLRFDGLYPFTYDDNPFCAMAVRPVSE